MSVDCVVDYCNCGLGLSLCHYHCPGFIVPQEMSEYKMLKVARGWGYVLPSRHKSTHLVRFCWLRRGSPPHSCQTPGSSSLHWGRVSLLLCSDCVPQRATAVDSPSCGREWAGASGKQTTWTFVGKQEKQIWVADTQKKTRQYSVQDHHRGISRALAHIINQ